MVMTQNGFVVCIWCKKPQNFQNSLLDYNCNSYVTVAFIGLCIRRMVYLYTAFVDFSCILEFVTFVVCFTFVLELKLFHYSLFSAL